MWERKLIEQSSSPVSSSLFPLHLGPPSALCLHGTHESSGPGASDSLTEEEDAALPAMFYGRGNA